MRFGSVCSGIEAASVAWHPLGWKAAWLSEIEPFPCAVLAHHYPEVPNLGDMTALPEMIRAGLAEAPDVFTGGTPCQAFSVAGKRDSLGDARGNLSLTFCEIANAIDHVRAAAGREPCIVVWENVPGVLSTKDNAFGCFLGSLSGAGCELQPAGERWADAGVVLGPQRAVAWRVLDAQYFGLAQRRRRVFVVASARAGFNPGEVLLEFDGLRRDSAPRREAREGSAAAAENGAVNGGTPQPAAAGSWWDGGQVSQTLDAVLQKGQTMPEKNRFPAVLVPETIGTLTSAGGHAVPGNTVQDAMAGQLIPLTAHTLRAEGFDAGEDGTGRGTPLVPVKVCRKCGSAWEIGWGEWCDVCGESQVRPVPIQNATRGEGQNGLGIGGDVMFTLDTASQHAIAFHHNAQADQLPGPDTDTDTDTDTSASLTCSQQAAVAFHENQRGEITTNDTAGALNKGGGKPGQGYPAVAAGMAVRRLTPRECERLQGFPDDYTLIPWRKKPADACPDGPRYKALGNSWAVPCAAWIGRRIQEHLG